MAKIGQKLIHLMWFHKVFQTTFTCRLYRFQVFIFKICQTVASISMISQFDDFFKPDFCRDFTPDLAWLCALVYEKSNQFVQKVDVESWKDTWYLVECLSKLRRYIKWNIMPILMYRPTRVSWMTQWCTN